MRAARALRGDPDEAFAAQHGPLVDRVVMTREGEERRARGYDAERTLRRLAKLCDGEGRPWLSAAELAIAAQLRRDWERGEQGLVRGSDWSAPSRGESARGPAHDFAIAAHCDARQRVAQALARLAPPLRSVVERVCFRDEALERTHARPARSAKLALKLALAQLAGDGG